MLFKLWIKLYVSRKRVNIRGNVVNEWDYTTEYKSNLTAPPMWRNDNEEEYRARCQRLCNTAIEEVLTNRDKPAMGMTKVMGQETYRDLLGKDIHVGIGGV